MEYDPIPEAGGSHPPTRPRAREASPAGSRRRLTLWLVLPLATVLLAILTGVVVAASIRMPEAGQKLEDFVPRLVTTLYDRDGQEYRRYKRENRVMLEEGEIPELVRNAVLAAEDDNFYNHGGIDLKGALRAAVKNLVERRKAEGASTITMQLANMLFLTREKTWKRKFEQVLLAVELEKQFSKQQILTLYCNLINLSHGNYGVEAAARAYFNKTAAELDLPEAATLAGIAQRPSRYRIRANKEAVLARRNTILGRMLAEVYITEEEHAAAVAAPLLVAKPPREAELGPYFAEEVRRYLAATYGTDTLYDRGLQVHTTLDRDIQRAAEDALDQGLLRLDHRKGWRGPSDRLEQEELEAAELPGWNDRSLIPGEWYEGLVLESGASKARVKIGAQVFDLGPKGFAWTGKKQPKSLLSRGDVAWFRLEPEDEEAEDGGALRLHLEQAPEIQGAALVLESATGAVRAMVGGWDYDSNEFNRVTQARRQVGSAFKPFVFGAALETGYTPADTLFDGPVAFAGSSEDNAYSPRNNSRRYYGILTLRQALERSINVTSVKLMDLVGIENVIEFARRSGIQADLPPYPSLALGAADMTPIEISAAYAAIANQGIYVEPYLVERITHQDGRLLQEHLPRAHKAMDPQIAYLLTRMLRGVVQRGTATSLAKYDVEVVGKTGTTNGYTDAWFVGFTPRYTIAVWVGYDKNRSIGPGMTGTRAALPIWEAILSRGLEDGWLAKGESFPKPPGVVEVEIEYYAGLRPGPGATRLIQESFLEGSEPEQSYGPEWAEIMQLPWYQQEPFYLPKEGERMPGQVEDWSGIRERWARKSR